MHLQMLPEKPMMLPVKRPSVGCLVVVKPTNDVARKSVSFDTTKATTIFVGKATAVVACKAANIVAVKAANIVAFKAANHVACKAVGAVRFGLISGRF